jgi:type I restriction enzyme R subunit
MLDRRKGGFGVTPRPPESLDYSEDGLIEQPAIELLGSLGWETANLYHETFGRDGTVGRETDHEVVLVLRLRAALQRLNAGLPAEAITQAIEELTRARTTMSLVNANNEIYQHLKNGVRVTVRQSDGRRTTERVRIIDWEDLKNNDLFLASQLWVSGDMYRKRCDLVGFVNGLPLVFIELKASHRRLEDAYKNNLRDYKETIPQLFWFNGFIILSNGSKSRIGSVTASLEHFAEWKKINDEGEEGVVSLDTILRGTCDPKQLFDILENFVVFEEAQGGLVKKVGMNHQYLGVNRAIGAVRHLGTNRGRLGVFWHTQGSGKSISMVFFAQKIMRKIDGNWTFLIVTDRQELDAQIYKQFAACGAVTEKQAQATSAGDLKRLLTEDHRYVFTLIQKFRNEPGKKYPELSDRSNIIVITDEAHRSQYDAFALNMRNALPNAAFIGFTGTPLMAGEEKTKEVFGDYVSTYTYRQSTEDGATVPLYYENRIPELQLKNKDLHEDMEKLLEAAELDEEQEKKLQREFAKEYHLITRDERLDKVGEDIVNHFMGRGQKGKAMVVCIDKATAVRMYDKVQKFWKKHLKDLRARAAKAEGEEKAALERNVRYMAETDMAVVVSPSQNEITDMRKKGLDMEAHRRRMVKEDLEVRFKEADDPFRLVFVCAMWMTGFDVPSCSTIYLDKPMRNHTLMQTIARANRVFPDKAAGLIVDYVGVFRNLQKALAIYAGQKKGGTGECPIKSKAELLELLKKTITEAEKFCEEHDVDLAAIQATAGFKRVALLDDAVDSVVLNDDNTRKFLSLSGNVTKVYKAILPDKSAGEFAPTCVLLAVIAEKIRSMSPEVDISEVMGDVDKLLDASIGVDGFVIRERPKPYETDGLVDLGKIDIKKLQAQFAKARQHLELERLRNLISKKLQEMVLRNRSRMNYLEQFQKLVDEYNAGSRNTADTYKDLLQFIQTLNKEDKRGIVECLSDEELALFDLLTKPEPKLTKKQEADVKKVVKTLLENLKHGKLVLDWRQRQQSRQDVRLCIEVTLDTLPPVYTRPLYAQKCDLAYRHVYDAYSGEGRSVYSQ